MEKLLFVGVLLLFFTISCQHSASKNNQQFDKLVKQLNDHIHPLESPLPTSTLTDLAPLNSVGNSNDEMILASSNLKYQTMYKLVRNLQQVYQHLYDRQKRNDRSLRDKNMAENALWASQLFGEKTKIAVWSHNGHISELKSGNTPMGYHLDKKIGDDYISIAFSFNKGTFTAVGLDTARNKPTNIGFYSIESPPTKDSINHLFSFSQDDNFIFNVDSLEPNSALGLM